MVTIGTEDAAELYMQSLRAQGHTKLSLADCDGIGR